jgi:hypothetical protein
VDRIDLYIASSAINKVDLYVDRNRLFSNQFNWVTYKTNHRGGLVYDYLSTRLSNPTQYYYRLYALDAERFPFREMTAVGDGVWDTTTGDEGLHTVTIRAQDVNGNVSVAHMQVDVQHQPILNRRMAVPYSGWHAELRDFHDFLEVVCQSTTPLKALPVVVITRQDPQKRLVQESKITLTLQGSNYFVGTYPLISDKNGELTLTLQAAPQSGEPFTQTWNFPVNYIVAARGGSVKIPHAAMTFPAGALYHDIFANIFPTTSYQETQGLPVIGKVYDFRPAGVPLEKKGSIRIQYPQDFKRPKTLGIYWWDTIKERWYFMDDQHDPKTYALTANIIYPSIYAILNDTIAPTISDVVPAHNSAVEGDALTLQARIKDIGKGVDEASIVMTLDGKRLDGEYDPDRYTYKYPLTRTLASGRHILTIQAADKAGHSAQQQTSTFTVQ